ncbi:hypothetical protein BpHYR1_040466 [Brachionus plicatilis]|uniref:Uncharacterized protein n=1 Tax=Brachionus plicatilis TaxID=10195 RepID=A0A3M7REG5_BRAPC|nr:hypothetical protein BpHYR1_040466 [Brachionus plicatilis]
MSQATTSTPATSSLFTKKTVRNASLPLDIQEITTYISNLYNKKFYPILKFRIKQIRSSIILFVSFECYLTKSL